LQRVVHAANRAITRSRRLVVRRLHTLGGARSASPARVAHLGYHRGVILTRRHVLIGAAAAIPAGALALGRESGGSAPAAKPAERVVRAARDVAIVVAAQATVDGAGVKLHRAIGARLPMLDPFLLLDEFQSDDPDDYAAGFPDHPHRGFETVTYMIHGAMEHRDSVGNRGRLGPGSAQWMTAGHGIVHSEMPKQERGLMWGFQLWVNLPARDKMIRPRYQDIPPERVPEVALDRARVRVVAGSAFDVRGPVDGIDVDPLFIDVALERGGTVTHPLPAGHNAFAFVTDGAARIGASGREVRRGELAVLAPTAPLQGDFVAAAASDGARIIVAAGRPLGEPVARRGPFVMNTNEEIRRAFEDYRTGRLTDGA